jgi:hypothetical protein
VDIESGGELYRLLSFFCFPFVIVEKTQLDIESGGKLYRLLSFFYFPFVIVEKTHSLKKANKSICRRYGKENLASSLAHIKERCRALNKKKTSVATVLEKRTVGWTHSWTLDVVKKRARKAVMSQEKQYTSRNVDFFGKKGREMQMVYDGPTKTCFWLHSSSYSMTRAALDGRQKKE